MNRDAMIAHLILLGWEPVCTPSVGWGIAQPETAKAWIIDSAGKPRSNWPWTRCDWGCLRDAKLQQLVEWLENTNDP